MKWLVVLGVVIAVVVVLAGLTLLGVAKVSSAFYTLFDETHSDL